MARIEPDPFLGHHTELADGERLVAEFRPDPQVYWRAHLIVAVILGIGAGFTLLWLGNPYPVVGPVGAVLAIAARAALVQSEAMDGVWRLTDRRLLGPGGPAIPLAQLLSARPLLGAAQVTTVAGDRHLIRYQSDAATVSYLLMTAAGRRPRTHE